MNQGQAIKITHLLLRVVSGLLFMQNGGSKLFGWFGVNPNAPVPQGTEIWFAGVLELIGGAMILVGMATRPAAFIVAGEMAVAYFRVHQPQGLWPLQNHGEHTVLFCFIFLFMAAFGGGNYSVDAWLGERWGRRRHKVTHERPHTAS